MKRLLLWMIFCCLIGACSSGSISTPTPTWVPESTETVAAPTQLSEPTRTPVLPTQTPLPPTATTTVMSPTATPLPACVTLVYSGYAQFEIIDLAEQRILLDVHDPEKLSGPVRAADILLTTHTHWDHVNEEFLASFPGQQLFVQAGILESPGVTIQGIASAHNAGEPLKPEGGTNYIYLIEIGGLRIAHFGDIGQNALTAEQLEILGRVDIALTQINNPFSEMNAENRKGLNLMKQLQPRLVIPTHINLDATKLAVAQWPGFYAETPSLKICASDLGEQTQFLLIGEDVATMIKYVELAAWGAE